MRRFAFLVGLLALVHAGHSRLYEFKDNPLIVGGPGPNDRIIQQYFLLTSPSSPNSTETQTSKYVINGDGYTRISQMKVYDRSVGQCAYAVPVNGGPDSTFVVLEVTALPNCRVNYTVELYGEPAAVLRPDGDEQIFINV